MSDFIRKILSYWGLFKKMRAVKPIVEAKSILHGEDSSQYFLHFEPPVLKSDKIIIWVHGGGWTSGSPDYFDFVGQTIAKQGYHCISIGYRLAPKYKYPAQIEDVCSGYNKALAYLTDRELDSSKLIVSGPSAGAHLTSLLCYSKDVQEKYGIDVSNVIGFIGVGGPYNLLEKQSFKIRTILRLLFTKNYDRSQGDPSTLMTKNHIPMLLIHSRHDGVIDFSSAEHFHTRAQTIGISSELYSVIDPQNTHSYYTTGMFLEERSEYKTLDKFFNWIEER